MAKSKDVPAMTDPPAQPMSQFEQLVRDYDPESVSKWIDGKGQVVSTEFAISQYQVSEDPSITLAWRDGAIHEITGSGAVGPVLLRPLE